MELARKKEILDVMLKNAPFRPRRSAGLDVEHYIATHGEMSMCQLVAGGTYERRQAISICITPRPLHTQRLCPSWLSVPENEPHLVSMPGNHVPEAYRGTLRGKKRWQSNRHYGGYETGKDLSVQDYPQPSRIVIVHRRRLSLAQVKADTLMNRWLSRQRQVRSHGNQSDTTSIVSLKKWSNWKSDHSAHGAVRMLERSTIFWSTVVLDSNVLVKYSCLPGDFEIHKDCRDVWSVC